MADRATSPPQNRLRELRQQHGFDITGLAAEIGKSSSTYSRYEAGRSPIPDELKLALARKYGVSVEYLMGWDGEQPAVAEALAS